MTIQQIATPSEGQAIDVSYIGKVIASVNGLAENFADLASQSNISSDVSGDSKEVLTQMLNINAKTFRVAADTTSVVWDFGRAYKFPPVVVASIEGSTDLVYIERVGISNCIIRFAGGGKATVQSNLHAIAIGIFEST